MNGIFFYIGLGAGLAAACGLRPFLPVLLAGALASAKALGVSFSHDPFRFLQDDWWLLVVVVVLVLAYVMQLTLGPSALPDANTDRSRPAPLAAALAGLAYGAGALLFAGTLAAHGDAWWPGLLGGLAAVALTQSAVVPIFERARARLTDGAAKQALSVYLDAASLLLAALVALLHPLGYVALALLLWLLVRSRARGEEKYAGLRILRR
jgi:protein-S-isoprenylcysteine O-methyltransferase Ste14